LTKLYKAVTAATVAAIAVTIKVNLDGIFAPAHQELNFDNYSPVAIDVISALIEFK